MIEVTNSRLSLEAGVATLYPEVPQSQLGYMARMLNSRLNRVSGGDTSTFLITNEQPDSKPLFYITARNHVVFVLRK